MTIPNEAVIKDRLMQAVSNQRSLRRALAAAAGDTGLGEEPETVESAERILEELRIDDDVNARGTG